MAEEKKLSVGEIRRTIATSLGTAFGFVIALLWSGVVMGGLKVANVETSVTDITMPDWIKFMITAVVLTVVMVILIVVISRWGNK